MGYVVVAPAPVEVDPLPDVVSDVVNSGAHPDKTNTKNAGYMHRLENRISILRLYPITTVRVKLLAFYFVFLENHDMYRAAKLEMGDLLSALNG